MPKYPDPDNLPSHKFPHQLLESISENSQNGSFLLLCRSDDGEFVMIPHFTNLADKWAFYSFLLAYSGTMVENQTALLDDQISGEMFGEGEEED